MTTLRRPGAELDHDETGTGAPVFLLHGLTSSRASAQTVENALAAAVVKDHRLIRYDARGHGRSTGSPVNEEFAWHNLADDLLALADVVSPDAPIDAVGVSMGAATILHAVVRRPERFRRLVLALPPTAWQGRRAQRLMYRMNAAKIERRGLAAFAAGVTGAPTSPAQDGPNAMPDLVPGLAASVLRGAALSDLPDPAQLERVTHPVLLLGWVDDPTHPVGTLQELDRLLPDSTAAPVAQAPQDVRAWGELVSAHLAG